MRAVPRLCVVYPGICLTTEEKARKNLNILHVYPLGGKIFRTRPDRLWTPPSLLHSGYRAMAGGLRGRDVALGTQSIQRRSQRKSTSTSILLLCIHGILHGAFHLYPYVYNYMSNLTCVKQSIPAGPVQFQSVPGV